jgi:hypothetical protein
MDSLSIYFIKVQYPRIVAELKKFTSGAMLSPKLELGHSHMQVWDEAQIQLARKHI